MPINAAYPVKGEIKEVILPALSTEELEILGGKLNLVRAKVVISARTPSKLREKIGTQSALYPLVRSLANGRDFRKEILELEKEVFHNFISKAHDVAVDVPEFLEWLPIIQKGFGLLTE